MAECSSSSLIVAGPVDASRNSVLGTYQADGTTTVNGQTFTRYVLGGDTEYRIQAAQIGGGPDAGKFAWFLYAPISGPPGVGVEQYKTTSYDTVGELPDCPFSTNTTWVVNSVSVPGSAPTVAANAPDPYAQWGGYANYARLRLLEYI
jgi:hypothetical protein